MSIKQRYTTKQAIVAALTALIAVLNFMTLLFAIVSVNDKRYGIGRASFLENGFTLAFGKCDHVSCNHWIIEDVIDWLEFYCMAHFIIALIFVVALALRAILRWGKPFGKLGVFSDFMALAMSVIYMISGISANSAAHDTAASIYFDSHTAAFIPLILITLAILAILLIKWYMPDDFAFDFGGKGKKKK